MFNIIFAIRILGQAVDLGCVTLIPQVRTEFVWPMEDLPVRADLQFALIACRSVW